MRRLSATAVILLAAGCASRGGAPQEASRPALRAAETEVTVIQRTSAHAGDVRIIVGDITGEIAPVEVVRAGSHARLAALAMRNGDVLKFESAGRDRFLKLVKLVNLPIGDDYAIFEISSTSGVRKAETLKRPDRWAQPLEVEGVPNLHRVAEGVYRSAQPTSSGMQNLREMGIRTIINLRTMHSDSDEIGTTPLRGVHIPMDAWAVNEDHVVEFLKIAADEENLPLLFHCAHGADRTGTMCAMYRICVQGWSRIEALKEMREGGFNFHSIWTNLPIFVDTADVNRIRQRAGIE